MTLRKIASTKTISSYIQKYSIIEPTGGKNLKMSILNKKSMEGKYRTYKCLFKNRKYS